MLTVQRMKRVELWSNLQSAGGQRLRFFLDHHFKACEARVTLVGDDRLTFSIPKNDPKVIDLRCGNVLRTWQDDAVWDEWVITDDAIETGNGLASVTCAPAEQKLSRAAIVGQVDGLGVMRHDIPVASLTPTEHLSMVVIPWLQSQGINWVSIGTIESAAPIDVTITWESPLAVIKRIAQTAELEFQLRRNGTAGYFIDLLVQIGGTAQQIDCRMRKNLKESVLARAMAEQVTQIYPRGAEVDGESATMGNAVWQVTAVAGAVVTLADPNGGDGPIAFDDQLNTLYLERPNGARILINDSAAATQQLTLAAGGPVVNELVQIRADVNGTELTRLEAPIDKALYGVVSAVLDATDIPGARNLVPNPAVRTWPGGLPTGWALVGGTAVGIKHPTLPEIKTGPQSLRVDTNADGHGAIAPVTLTVPTPERPFFSCYANIWVELGQVRVELVVTKADASTVVLPAGSAVATSSVMLQFEALGISGEDLNALTAVSAQLRVVQHGATAARFFIDSAQVTQSPTQEAFVEGAGGTKLWQRSNERLLKYSTPIVTLSSDVLDVARLNPSVMADGHSIVLGCKARVTDPRILVAPLTTRVVEIVRNYAVNGETSFTLSNNPEDLSGVLTRPDRPARVAPDTRDQSGALAYCRCSAEITAATDNEITVQVVGSAPGRVAKVRLVDLNGATQNSGPALGTLSPSGQVWTFARPISGSAVQVLTFEAVAQGCVNDSDLLQIPGQGEGLVASTCIITPTSTTATQISFTVTAADPASGGSNVTLEVLSAVGVSAPTPSPVIGASPRVQAYTVTRPAFGSGMAKIVFRSTCAGHIAGLDSIDIPPQDRDTQSAVVSPKIIAETATTITVQVDASSPNGGGTPVVRLAQLNGSATINTGAAVGTDVAGGSQWVFNRGAFQSGPGEAIFRASLAGYESTEKALVVPEKLQDSAGQVTAEVKVDDVVLSISLASTYNSCRYAYDDSAMPSDGTAAAGTVVVGRTATEVIANVVPSYGDRLYIKVIPYTDAAGGGTAGPAIRVEVQRQGGRKPKTMRGHWQSAGWKTKTGPQVSTDFVGQVAAVAVNADNTPYNIRHHPPLPDGAVVLETRCTVKRGNANAAITHTFYRVPTSTAGSFTVIGATQTSVTTGADETLVNGSLNEDTTGFAYAIEVTLQKGVGQANGNALALTWEIDYEVPDTDITI